MHSHVIGKEKKSKLARRSMDGCVFSDLLWEATTFTKRSRTFDM